MNFSDLSSYNFTKMLLLLISTALFMVASFFCAVIFLVRIPEDFLVNPKSSFHFLQNAPFALQISCRLLKNLVGLLLLAVGIFMLIAPGPGILTIMIAAMMIDFPAKASLQRLFMGQQPILSRINRLRERFKKRPLIHPSDANQI